jgi:ankyrin repeat protein
MGNTPLHYAIAYKKNKIVQLLIDSGADENITNQRNKTPWEGL